MLCLFLMSELLNQFVRKTHSLLNDSGNDRRMKIFVYERDAALSSSFSIGGVSFTRRSRMLLGRTR